MRRFLALLFACVLAFGEEIPPPILAPLSPPQKIHESALESSGESSPKSTRESTPNIIEREFPIYRDADLANALISRFSPHNENYFLPYYHTIFGRRAPYEPIEAKLQFSAKALLSEDLGFGVGLFFAYTQTSFFQIYAPKISRPVRDSDYSPELVLYKPLNLAFLGGEIHNFRLGYRHLSNGEGDFARSRGMDRIVAEIAWRRGFEAGEIVVRLSAWAYLSSEQNAPMRYRGYSDLALFGTLFKRHHLSLNVQNLIHDYRRYKGALRLEYKFDLARFSIFAQYFYGHGDNLFQYNLKTQSVGVGIAVPH